MFYSRKFDQGNSVLWYVLNDDQKDSDEEWQDHAKDKPDIYHLYI